MCCVESSPGRPQIDPKWRPATPHEAPPTGGILGIYNRSDRRRWYWQCFDCKQFFEAAPGLSLFRLPSDDELMEEVRAADLEEMSKRFNRIYCPHCSSPIEPKYKKELNSTRGVWVPDGCRITPNRELIGTPHSSSIAGYWMGGVAAAYQAWKSLVMRYLQGLREYVLTGSEITLQTTVNTDQGMPYMSRHLLDAKRGMSTPEERADDKLQRYVVPEWARFVLVSVDVQGGSTSRFVVQAHAIGPFMEQALIDRYDITKSERPGMGEEFAPIDPANYAEDWDILTKRLVKGTYKTTIAGRELRNKLVIVDAFGEGKKRGAGQVNAEGVTEKAYAWYRRVRTEGFASRVMLVKGNNTKTEWLIKETQVGRRNTQEQGDIPLYLLNPNAIKDAVSAGLKRQIPGPGFRHFPKWLKQAFFDELSAEVRNENGVWEQIRARNEAFDLCCYIHAGCLRLNVDKLTDWDNVPGWCKPLAENTDIVTREERQELQATPLAAPAEPGRGPVAQPGRVVQGRRRVSSGYLG
jgi:phage terminase large subunit GpA-like protein